MKQKILVAFDDSENSMRAVEYLARTFSKDVRITLFSVLQDTAALCDMNSPELTSYFKSQQTAFCALEDQKRKLVLEALDRAKESLVAAGFDPANITLKAEAKKKGVARDIILEAGEGYNLVVLGRHGISGIKDFFYGSTSQKVLSSIKDVSVLVVN
jgi:nucleotide-binding universal stress UspA family protein